MRSAALALLALAVLATEEDGRDRAFVGLETEEGPVFVGQEFGIGLEIGWESAWFEKHGVPLFLRNTDVPLQVDGAWLAEIPGTAAVEEPPERLSKPTRAQRATIAVGEQVLSGMRSASPTTKRDGRQFSTVSLRRTFVATKAGTLTIPAPSVRWAWSSRFEDDALGGRRALERREESATGAEGSIEVLPVPEQGRPATWAGAIGNYSIDASVSATEVEAGGSIRLVVRFSGSGNLSRIERPGPATIAGFHVLGLLDDRGLRVRTLTYDLSPVDEKTREVPMLPIAYLRPRPTATWCEEWTAPIPIRVVPTGKLGEVAPAAPPAPEPGGGSLAVVIGGAAAVLMGAFVALWRAMRARAREEAGIDPAAERVSAAAASLRSAAASPGADLGGPLAEFLAAGLGVPAAAAIGPDLAPRLAAAGVPEARARDAAALLEALVAARYGGAPPADAPAAAAAIARELEPLFATRYFSSFSPNTRA